MRLQVLAPDGQVIAATDVDRIELSTGAVGVRVVLRDVNGVFDLTTTRIDALNGPGCVSGGYRRVWSNRC